LASTSKAFGPKDLWAINIVFLKGEVCTNNFNRSKGGNMCYTCGCDNPDDSMGDPRNITNKTFEEAAKAAGEKPDEAKKNALKLLKKVLKEK
jgi:hypothetical protein